MLNNGKVALLSILKIILLAGICFIEPASAGIPPPIESPKVPEPNTTNGLLALGALGLGVALSKKLSSSKNSKK